MLSLWDIVRTILGNYCRGIEEDRQKRRRRAFNKQGGPHILLKGKGTWTNTHTHGGFRHWKTDPDAENQTQARADSEKSTHKSQVAGNTEELVQTGGGVGSYSKRHTQMQRDEGTHTHKEKHTPTHLGQT